MSLIVTNNIYSLNAQRNLNKSQSGLASSLEKLSSGYRINRAGDDAAGLAISEKLRSNVRALSQASRNTSDGIGLIQTAEGAMAEVNNMLVRMKELSEQSATGTLGSTERGYLNQEYQALRAEITRIADDTKFNDTNLLDGSLSIGVQIGIESGQTLTISVSDVDATSLSLTTGIGTVTNASAAITSTTAAIGTVSGRRSGLGALQNRMESIISNLGTVVENLTSAESRIRDVDIAQETANMTRYNIMVQAGISVLAQANQAPSVALSLL